VSWDFIMCSLFAEMHTNSLKFLMTKSSHLKDVAKLVGINLFIKISCLLMRMEFANPKKPEKY